MCEIFGSMSTAKRNIKPYLKEFFTHSDKHPHGWGLACLDDHDNLIEKEPLKATNSYYLKHRLTGELTGKVILAHIRYATIGNVEYTNCHPFTRKDSQGRHWTFIHNGTIFNYPPLAPYVKTQTGDTDSERILMYLVDQVNRQERKKGTAMNSRERFELLDQIVCEMAKENKLNFLLYDGEQLYVHTNYADSLYYLEKENQVLFSTRPLGREEWLPVPFTTLLAYQNGKKAYSGTNHHNEHFDNEENLKYLFQIFSNL